MDHAPAVSVLNRLGDLGHQRSRLARRQGPLGQTSREALALDEGHGEIMLSLVLADLKDRNNPRVVEAGGGFRFGVEAFDVDLLGELAGQDHLHGDRPIEADLPGVEDDAHSAARDLADQLVVTEVAHADRRHGIEPGRLGRDMVDGGLLTWRHGLLRLAQLALEGAQLGSKGGSTLVTHIGQIVVDTRLAPLPPGGLEAPADLINPAGEVNVQAAKVRAGSVTHLDPVLGPRSIGCWPPEPA